MSPSESQCLAKRICIASPSEAGGYSLLSEDDDDGGDDDDDDDEVEATKSPVLNRFHRG